MKNTNRNPEIQRKVDVSSSMLLGNDTFWLNMKLIFDDAFTMRFVCMLYQNYDNDFVYIGEEICAKHP